MADDAQQTKYPNSRDWEAATGMVLSGCNDKIEQHERIKRLGLPHLDFIVYRDDWELEQFIQAYKPVVTAAIGSRLKKVGLDIRDIEEFHRFRRSLDRSETWNIFVGTMVEALPDSYVGTAVSDGEGRLLLEFCVKPYMTEIRELTAGRCESRDLAHCYVIDFDDVIVTTDRISPSDLRYLRYQLAGIKGYLEFIKGLKNGIPGIYFVQHENTSAFKNYLDMTEHFHFDLTNRARSVYLKWHQ